MMGPFPLLHPLRGVDICGILGWAAALLVLLPSAPLALVSLRHDDGSQPQQEAVELARSTPGFGENDIMLALWSGRVLWASFEDASVDCIHSRALVTCGASVTMASRSLAICIPKWRLKIHLQSLVTTSLE